MRGRLMCSSNGARLMQSHARGRQCLVAAADDCTGAPLDRCHGWGREQVRIRARQVSQSQATNSELVS
jgi:hypothetical protein